MFHAGLPIGTAPGRTDSPGRTTDHVQPTVASVGPYSLTTVAVGCRSRHRSRTSPRSCSPPTTRSPVGENPSGSSSSSARWLGVALSSPQAKSPAPSSGVTRTVPPTVSGTCTAVTVRSNAIGEWNSDSPRALG